MNRHLTIAEWVDADNCYGNPVTSDEQYDGLEADIKRDFEATGHDLLATFKRDVMPHKLDIADVYLIDFGGLNYSGMSGFSDSVGRHLLQKIEDLPNTLFILVSQVSGECLRDIAEEAKAMGAIGPNVHVSETPGLEILRWLDLIPQDEHNLCGDAWLRM